MENREVKLYLVGDGVLKDYHHKKIVYYKGFVSEEEKLRYMKNAIAFIHHGQDRLSAPLHIVIVFFIMGVTHEIIAFNRANREKAEGPTPSSSFAWNLLSGLEIT